jgi:two-component sensor histidine kinase
MVGKHISILAPHGFEPEQQSLLERVRSGKEMAPYDTLRRHKDGMLVQVSIRAAPILTSEATPSGIAETMRDITERKQAEERNALLMRELDHRTKNLLALVQSTMVQTAEHSTSKESFVQSVTNRLRAMAQAQDVLIANNLKGAFVEEVVRSALKPFIVSEPSLEMHGQPVFLKADAVHPLSLVLHELATNALKYGALTQPRGRIVVSWELDGVEVQSRRFRMSWREIDGPPVLPPQRTGFGTEVINHAPKHGLGAQVTLAYDPAGIEWSIDIPADRAVEAGKGDPISSGPSHPVTSIIQLNDLIVDRFAALRATLGDRVNVSASLQPGLAPIQVDPSELWGAVLDIASRTPETVESDRFVIETRNTVLDECKYAQLVTYAHRVFHANRRPAEGLSVP